MAHRMYQELEALNKQVKVISGSFATDANGDAENLLGSGFSVSHPAFGVYQIDLEDSYVDLLSGCVDVALASPTLALAQLSDIDVGSSKSLKIKVTIPTASDLAEATTVDTLAEDSAYEVTEVTFVAEAGITQADYFTFENVAGDKYAFWLDIDAAGTAPTGAAYVAATHKVKVSIATGDSAFDVASKVYATVQAQSIADVTVTFNQADTLTFTQDLWGACVNAAPHDAGDLGAGTVVVVVATAGANSSFNNTYFTIFSAHDVTGYYVWMNVGGQGTDPAVVGKTGVEVAIASGATDAQVATAIAAAVNALADFVSAAVVAQVTITNAAVGATTASADGAVPTGYTVTETVVGDSKLTDVPSNAANRVQFELYLKNSTLG